MPKNVQPSAADSAPTHVAFETGNLKVEFAFVGVGVAVMVPSWQKEAADDAGFWSTYRTDE